MTKTQTVEEFVVEFNTLAGTFGQDMTDGLKECIPIIQSGVAENFDGAKSSDGMGWPLRKDSGPTHPLLILEGHLKAAAIGQGAQSIEEVSQNELVLGVDHTSGPGSVLGARRHQFGDAEIMGVDWIQARPFMGISEKVADACTEVIADHAMKVFE